MKKGFTLIELLVVIAIIAILAGIVIIAVNPTRQVALARNAQRRADVLTNLNAIYQFFIDNGNFPSGIDATPQQLGTNTSGCNISCGDWTTAAACLDLSGSLVPTYLSAIPFDPQGSASITGYAVKGIETAGRISRITVRACLAELGASIEVTR